MPVNNTYCLGQQVLQWPYIIHKKERVPLHLHLLHLAGIAKHPYRFEKQQRTRPCGRIPKLFLPVLIKIGDFAR